MRSATIISPCAHRFVVAVAHPGYEECTRCGSFRSLQPADPATLYTPDYWSHALGHSTLPEQVYNVDGHREAGRTKYEAVLRAIDVEARDCALEIGCAPGRLLLHLRGLARFARVVGLEACREYEEAIRGIGCHGGPLLWGFFPQATADEPSRSYDLIVALDVFEHCAEPEAFLAECARLLARGGQLLLMLPLVTPDLPARMFTPAEHIWIHAPSNLFAMMQAAGLSSEMKERWCPGHQVVSGRVGA